MYNKLEVGPRSQLVAGRGRCVEVNGDSETATSDRPLCTEALHRLEEAPSWDNTQLDVTLCRRFKQRFGVGDQRGVLAANEAPAVVERLDYSQMLAEADEQLVRQNGVCRLADLAERPRRRRRVER